MSIKLYNTLTRKKEVFKPMHDHKVNIFVCGPTVYDHPHLGHAKTYVQFDVIVRFLKASGFKVFYLQNITDIDDKIIRKAADEKKSWKEIGQEYETLYLEDMKKLNVVSVNKYARATKYIPEIISQVRRLIKKGYAYKISDGWYFDLSKDKDYGKLAHRTEAEAEDAVSRIDENKEKRNKGDFCLWKFSKPGEPVWKSKEIGDGRPGWHIEDTAITEKQFGPQYDIHGGGLDLIFPHHEAEIAQMEAISGKRPMVKYWMHTGFLEIDNEKMGKSKKNFYTIDEILGQYSPMDLRYFFLSAHYRKPLNFSLDNLDFAKNSLKKLKNAVSEFRKADDKVSMKKVEGAFSEFMKFLDDDVNTPRALSYMWEIIRDDRLNNSEKYKLIIKFDDIFGLELDKEKKIKIPMKVKKLAEIREAARREKKWEDADQLRRDIKNLGFVVEDTEDGYVLREEE